MEVETPSLRWRVSLSSSCFHAAAALSRQEPFADERLRAALQEPAAALLAELRGGGIEIREFFDQAVPLAADFESNRGLAERILAKLPSRSGELNQQAAGRLAGWFTELEAAFTAAVPRVVDELTLRSGPLRDQWEARGPGLLAAIARKTEPGVLPASAEVVLVHPALGGAGAACSLYNKVVLEAVLTNPLGDLPETVRLGWLLSTLNLDLPKYSETLRREKLPLLACLAMLPAALAAAEDVELIGERPSLARALTAWRLASDGAADSLAERLKQWWATYQESRPPWGVALAALDQLLLAEK